MVITRVTESHYLFLDNKKNICLFFLLSSNNVFLFIPSFCYLLHSKRLVAITTADENRRGFICGASLFAK